jgi:hypothetical protein
MLNNKLWKKYQNFKYLGYLTSYHRRDMKIELVLQQNKILFVLNIYAEKCYRNIDVQGLYNITAKGNSKCDSKAWVFMKEVPKKRK